MCRCAHLGAAGRDGMAEPYHEGAGAGEIVRRAGCDKPAAGREPSRNGRRGGRCGAATAQRRADALREVDVAQSSYSAVRWGEKCGLLPLFSSVLNLDVPQGSPLARRTQVTFADLAGRRIRVLRHGNDAMDRLRDALELEAHAKVIDVDSFDYALFNEAEEQDGTVVTSGSWAGLHPGFVTVPIACEHRVPCFLVYQAHPAPQVGRFVSAPIPRATRAPR